MKIKSETFFSSNLYEWEKVAPGISRKITAYNNDIMMVLVRFEEGSIGEPHSHPHSQSTYVESGEFEVMVGDKIQVLKKGDSFFAAPDIKHGVVCKQKGKLIDVFSPAREDFLLKSLNSTCELS